MPTAIAVLSGRERVAQGQVGAISGRVSPRLGKVVGKEWVGGRRGRVRGRMWWRGVRESRAGCLSAAVAIAKNRTSSSSVTRRNTKITDKIRIT
jgi:hypothetical protein